MGLLDLSAPLHFPSRPMQVTASRTLKFFDIPVSRLDRTYEEAICPVSNGQVACQRHAMSQWVTGNEAKGLFWERLRDTRSTHSPVYRLLTGPANLPMNAVVGEPHRGMDIDVLASLKTVAASMVLGVPSFEPKNPAGSNVETPLSFARIFPAQRRQM